MGKKKNRRKNRKLKDKCPEKKCSASFIKTDPNEKESKKDNYINNEQEALLIGDDKGKMHLKSVCRKISNITLQQVSNDAMPQKSKFSTSECTSSTVKSEEKHSASHNTYVHDKKDLQVSNIGGVKPKKFYDTSGNNCWSYNVCEEQLNISESDDEYASNFSKSALNNNYRERNVTERPKDTPCLTLLPYDYCDGIKDYEDSYSYSGSDDEYISSDFSKATYDDHFKRRNPNFNSDSSLSNTFDEDAECKVRRMDIKDKIYSSVDEYVNSKDSFSNMYHKWLPIRRNALDELQALYQEVHTHQMQYNKGQANLKDASHISRRTINQSQNIAVSFLASFATIVADSVSGISSFAHAVKVDSFQNKFQEIINRDAEITNEMYKTRSQCVTKYQGIEEVMRDFHSDTLSSTINKISNTLEVGKYWESMKNAYRNDDMTKLTNVVSQFFENACQSNVLRNVSNSIDKYVSDNPAALEGCKSTGKALYQYVATNTPAPRNSVMGEIHSSANFCLMIEDKKDADHLKSILNDDCNQSKLENQIEDAIESLQSEMDKMMDIYREFIDDKVYCIDSD